MVYRQRMQHNMKAGFLQGRMMPETAMGGVLPSVYPNYTYRPTKAHRPNTRLYHPPIFIHYPLSAYRHHNIGAFNAFLKNTHGIHHIRLQLCQRQSGNFVFGNRFANAILFKSFNVN